MALSEMFTQVTRWLSIKDRFVDWPPSKEAIRKGSCVCSKRLEVDLKLEEKKGPYSWLTLGQSGSSPGSTIQRILRF